MGCLVSTEFRGSSTYSYGSTLLAEELETNLITFFDWGLLGVSGYTNLQSGVADTRLYVLSDPNYSLGQVWGGRRKNWVWETGVGAINISGVYISGIRHTTGYFVNYREGTVTFAYPLATGAVVEVNRSEKNVWIDSYDETVNQEIQFGNNQFPPLGSGQYFPLSRSRVQLPAIGLELVASRSFRPYQIGGGQWVQNKVRFNILTETDADDNRLIDLVSYQSDLRIILFSSNAISASGAWPLTASGDRVNNPLMYPQLVEQFPYRQAQLTNMRVADKVKYSTNLYGAVIETDIVVDMQQL